ncbi:hypothetical protein ATANTOWER_024440 [Ataeniobius toweri]|uniref:Uncharacterized protein n=1 Tax=Ataeniobius toweri TaxID=208326 RepID=A0ABU7CA99_9TELE|nr:hypothetical protein [Ataeniobius toweri]
MVTAGLVTCVEGGGGKRVTLKLGLPTTADGGRLKLGEEAKSERGREGESESFPGCRKCLRHFVSSQSMHV